MLVSKKQFDIPDSCPEKCTLSGEYVFEYTGYDYCFKCPIHLCTGDNPTILPIEFNEELAEEWYEFFMNLDGSYRVVGNHKDDDPNNIKIKYPHAGNRSLT